MREILFRGKTKNGEWAEGNLLVYPDVNRAYIQKGDYFKGGAIEVKWSTVGQYTGLKDKNGKQIFEGDTIRCYGADWITYVVRFGRYDKAVGQAYYCGIGFYLERVGMKDFISPMGLMRGDESEVIGNIHDNPELLKGGEG